MALARSVYITNDERAAIKRELNVALGSAITEEKSYPRLRRGGPVSGAEAEAPEPWPLAVGR